MEREGGREGAKGRSKGRVRVTDRKESGGKVIDLKCLFTTLYHYVHTKGNATHTTPHTRQNKHMT